MPQTFGFWPDYFAPPETLKRSGKRALCGLSSRRPRIYAAGAKQGGTFSLAQAGKLPLFSPGLWGAV